MLEGEQSQWKIFPNPTKDYLNVSISKEMTGKEISIFDASGKKIFSQVITEGNIKIKTQGLPTGVYFLNVGYEMKQFLKE